LPCGDSGPLVDEGAAFNGKGLSKAGITEVKVPAVDLQIQAISNSCLQIF
jgi:hypothetical protein|tara:strand:- start:403 stop:552 length:150 start_codon:yes stop_codon:yes gene_type:complete